MTAENRVCSSGLEEKEGDHFCYFWWRESPSPQEDLDRAQGPTTLVEAMSKDLRQIATVFFWALQQTAGCHNQSVPNRSLSFHATAQPHCSGDSPQIPSTTVLVPRERAIHLFPAWGCGCPKVNNPAWATGNQPKPGVVVTPDASGAIFRTLRVSSLMGCLCSLTGQKKNTHAQSCWYSCHRPGLWITYW